MPLSRNELNKLLNETGPGNRKTQWKRLALKMHPNKGGNSNRFKNLSAAYNAYYKCKETGSAYTRKPPTPPTETEKRHRNILAKKNKAIKAGNEYTPIKVRLNRSPIIRFKNQENINFFRRSVVGRYASLRERGSGHNLKPNRNYYFIGTSAIPGRNRSKLLVLNISQYSTNIRNKAGLANKNELTKYFGIK